MRGALAIGLLVLGVSASSAFGDRNFSLSDGYSYRHRAQDSDLSPSLDGSSHSFHSPEPRSEPERRPQAQPPSQPQAQPPSQPQGQPPSQPQGQPQNRLWDRLRSFINIVTVRALKATRFQGALGDIMSHEPTHESNVGRYDDAVTLAHETSHGIHSWYRNLAQSARAFAGKVNAFYVMNNRAIFVQEPPGVRKSMIAAFVPPSLRGSRFNQYITGQQEWDDTPLYPLDEWNGYVNGAAAGMDQVRSGHRSNRLFLDGPMEFNAYAIALGMTVQRANPQYFNSNPQFREFLKFNLQRSFEQYKEAKRLNYSEGMTDQYYQKLCSSPDAEGLRQWARQAFGADWTRSVTQCF